MNGITAILPSSTREQASDLLERAATELRTECAARFAAEYARDTMTPAQRAKALQILQLFLADAAHEVREAVARQLLSCPFLPPVLARRMADDIESIALPVIRHAAVFTDADLIAIVQAGSEVKQIAVAGRDSVSEAVSDTLVETRSARVVRTLLANEGAEVGEDSLHKAVIHMGGDGDIQSLIARREALPLSVAHRLIAICSDAVRHELIERTGLPPALAGRVVPLAREAALAQRIAGAHDTRAVELLAARLYREGRLTSTLMLRALYEGDIHFFEAAIAARARCTVAKARAALFAGGTAALREICRRAELPKPLFAAVRSALELYAESAASDRSVEDADFTEHAIGRLVAAYPEIAPGGLDHVIAELAQKTLGTPPRKRKPV